MSQRDGEITMTETVCPVCDGGPGNDSACSCHIGFECEHHFHIAPWILTSNPPQEVHICCHCGERITHTKPSVKKHLIPDKCGKFHPERPGHCYIMMEREEKKEK
ncbi:hypothetical protein LCGC14_1184610 [marine sediment metagenome]|uniref:Uncharacterized protein n=1 Tax=marine sediment metagenome TaxID=412755 RepID=A0A0F9P433_9ZZZZ